MWKTYKEANNRWRHLLVELKEFDNGLRVIRVSIDGHENEFALERSRDLLQNLHGGRVWHEVLLLREHEDVTWNTRTKDLFGVGLVELNGQGQLVLFQSSLNASLGGVCDNNDLTAFTLHSIQVSMNTHVSTRSNILPLLSRLKF